jgi:hypothetical protein
MLVPALVLALSTPAAAQDRVPEAFRTLKPAQFVELVAAEHRALSLTAVQERQLDSLGAVIRSQPYRYQTSTSPSKGPRNIRLQPALSREREYAEIMGILTPEQRLRADALFGDPAYRLPSEFRSRTAAAGK